MIQHRWVMTPRGFIHVTEFALPQPPVPGEPEPLENALQRRYAPAETVDRECADSHETLADLFAVVWAEEAWARTEDHIDQQVANRARIDATRRRRGK